MSTAGGMVAVVLLVGAITLPARAAGPSRALVDEVAAATPLAGISRTGLFADAAGDEEAPEEGKSWSFEATGYWTSPPEDDAYASAILRADRGALHLEGRYNYEGKGTGSLFVGRTFEWSGSVDFSLVPMAGAVFGHTRGAAPGLEADLVWKRFEAYAELEYVFEFEGRDGNFFYMWTELTVTPVDWLTLGVVGQRTRAYRTDVEVDRGLLVGLHIGRFSATAYVFDVFTDDPYVMVGVTVSF